MLVCPYRHVPLYVDLTDDETAEFTALTKAAIRALEAASAPMGFNLGMNQGAVAGAGVAAHLHQHVVPRWGGDSNFLPIIARTKALPMLLEDVRSRLVEHWPPEPRRRLSSLRTARRPAGRLTRWRACRSNPA